jgi:peptide-methionine (S)-S-oxide reductase
MPGGYTPNATYEEVCSGGTGHAEVVRVIYDPNKVSYETLLKEFWESHDPTQGMRQGGDVGTQYRSAIYTTTDAQQKAAEASKRTYQAALTAAHRSTITTEIKDAPEFYYAEEYHQQYLAKNPNGYCGLAGCGVAFKAVVARREHSGGSHFEHAGDDGRPGPGRLCGAAPIYLGAWPGLGRRVDAQCALAGADRPLAGARIF